MKNVLEDRQGHTVALAEALGWIRYKRESLR